MDEVTIRDLRNHGGDVVNRVERGKTVLVTRAGVPVGELRPLPRPRLTADALLLRWRHVPAVDPVALRADLDAVLDPTLRPLRRVGVCSIRARSSCCLDSRRRTGCPRSP